MVLKVTEECCEDWVEVGLNSDVRYGGARQAANS